MLKKDKRRLRTSRSARYQKTTQEERSTILQMRKNGATSQEIRKVINKHVKTIQSVKNVYRKCIYKDLEKALMKYGFTMLIEQPNIMNHSQKDLKKLASQVIKTELESESSQFRHLIPASKLNSKRRRIFSKIAQDIVERINQTVGLDQMKKLVNQDLDTIDLLKSWSKTSNHTFDGEEQEDQSEIQSSGYDQLNQNLDASSPTLRFLIPNK